MPRQSREILVVGLNPAFQATLHFEHFRAGKVNRAFRKCNSIGGKGQNFAIACAQYGEADKLTVLQFVGGMTGRYIQAFLDEKKIEHVSITVPKATRTCTTVLDKRTGDMTELIEPAARIESREREELELTAKELLAHSPSMEAIALCGTLPPGITGSTYTLMAQLKPANVVMLLDAYQNAECLRTGKVDILKINAEEARSMIGASDDMELEEVGKHMHNQYKVKIIAITNGPDEAYLFEVGQPKEPSGPRSLQITKYAIPPILDVMAELDDIDSAASSPHSISLPGATGEPSPMLAVTRQDQRSASSLMSNISIRDRMKEIVINPLGAGDTCSAIFLLEYLDTQNAAIAFRHGLAAASASCLVVDYTSHFDIKVKNEIYDRIVPSTTLTDVTVLSASSTDSLAPTQNGTTSTTLVP